MPVLPERGDDDHLALVMVSTNEHRLDDTTIGKARKAASLIGRGVSPDEVANAFGVTRKTLREWEVLVGASTKVQAAVDEGRISASAAAKLAGGGVSKGDQDKALARVLAEAPAGCKATAKVAAKVNAEAQGKTLAQPVSMREVRAVRDGIRARVTREVPMGGIDGILSWVLGEAPEELAFGAYARPRAAAQAGEG